MKRSIRLAGLSLLLATLPLMLLGGCPTTGPTGPAFTSGTWSGTLSCEVAQSLSGTTTSTQTDTRTFSITFDDNGVPSSLTILGFSSSSDLEAGLAQVGDSVTLTSTSGTLAITQVVTVTQARYTSTTASITLMIDYSGSSGGLTQEGSATQTIQATVSGETLSYSAMTTYDVEFTASGLDPFSTGEVTTCEGLLALE